MAALGSLVVKLALEYAQYSQGLNRSEQEALASAKRIQDTMDSVRASVATSVGTIVGAIAAGLSINAFKNLIAGTIETNAALNDMAIQANTTVEALSGLAEIGRYSDVGAEQITASMNKLTKNLASASEESKGAGRAVQALGLDLDKFRQLKPEDQMTAVAKALGEFEDGASKSAVAMALYGKEGAKMLPFLKDLGEAGELQAEVTAAQAAAADSLSDNWSLLQRSGGAWKRELASAVIPAMDQGVQALTDLFNGTGGLREEVRRLAADGSIQQWTTAAINGLSYVVDAVEYAWRSLKSLGQSIGGVVAAVIQLGQGNFRGAFQALVASGEDISATWSADTMGAKFRARLAEVKSMGDEAAKTRKALQFDDTTEPKAKKEGESEYGKLVDRILERISLSQEEILVGRQLTEADKFRLKVLADMEAAGKKLTDTERARIQALLDEAEASDLELQVGRALIAQAKELAAERQKARNADYAASQRAIESLQDEWTRSTASVSDRIKSLRDEADAADLSARLNISLAQAVELVTIKRLEEKQAGFFDGSEGWQAIQKEIDKRRELLGLIAAKDQRDEWASIWRSVDQTAHDTFVNVLQGGQDAFRKLGNTLKSAVLDLLYQMTVKRWTLSIGTSVGAAGTATAGTGGSALGSVSSLSSAWNTLNNGVSSAITEGFTKLATSSFGQSIGLSTGATVGNNPSAYGAPQLTAAGSNIGAALGMAGNAAMGYGIYKGLSGGYKTNKLVDLGVVIGSVIPGIGPLIAGTVGAVINRAFGRKFVDQGLEGNFGGAAGFEGSSYKAYKGGWFRSDKTVRDALDPALQSGLATQFKTLQVQTGLMAQTLGLGTAAIADFTAHVRLSFKGLSEAQIQTRLQEEFAKVGESLAQTALGTAAYTRAGETAVQTLARLSGSLTTANGWLAMMRQRLFQVSLAGGDAASQLADLFGGLEQMTSAARAFYEAYYTEGERAADSQRRMTEALAAVNLTLPDSRAALRAMAEGLDLNSESGRKAYAVLLQLAPEFAATAEVQAQLARETAERLLDTFSGRQQLIPLLSATAGGVDALAQGMASATGEAALLTEGTWQIHRVLGEASSGVLYFGDRVGALGEPLSGAQLAAQALHEQIFDLRENAAGTAIDIAGLGAALASVDTQTFVATVSRVFERLGERVRTLLGDITGERIATREAALSIVNPTVMTRDQIARAIASSNVGLPTNAGVVAAQARLSEMDRLVAGARGALSGGIAQRDAAAAAVAATRGQIDATAQQRDQTAGAWGGRQGWFNNIWANRIGSWGWRMSLHDVYNAEAQQFNAQMGQFGASLGALGGTLASQQQAYDAARTAADQYGQQLAALAAGQAAALGAARQAQLAYVDSLQAYAIDASKAVGKLGRLREETVRYYEEQKRLADLMGSSAAGLRQTVADYRYAQLSPALQLDKLQSDFSTAYALALSTSGETLAGYGDKLNGLLGPLLDKAGEVLSGSAYDALVATTLARAETVAARIEQLTPTNYAAESLSLLGQIDTTLAALEDGAKSAERVIADAVKAGADQTTAGLRAVVAAVSGQPIPAFATGGWHAGGLRIVGENGPELEATGPSRIWTADQTRAMFSGGGRGDTTALEAEMRSLRAENRAQATALMQMQTRMTRLMERWDANGMPETRVVT